MFEFYEQDGTGLISRVLDSTYPETGNIVRSALALGGCVAGGCALALFDCRGSMSSLDRRSLRDIDLWMPDDDSVGAMLMSIRARGFVLSPSYGRFAFDVRPESGAPIVQVIVKRTGSAKEIVGGFDFVNCACALTKNGFVRHSKVDELKRERTLALQSVNSRFLPGRVNKYLGKGFTKVDGALRTALFENLSKDLKNAADLVSSSPDNGPSSARFSLQEKVRKSIGAALHFASLDRTRATPYEILSDDQRDCLRKSSSDLALAWNEKFNRDEMMRVKPDGKIEYGY